MTRREAGRSRARAWLGRFFLAAIAATTFGADLEHGTPAISEADAYYGTSRRVARRTARRTSHRQAAYYGGGAYAPYSGAAYVGVLPPNCGPYSGGYYTCGGAQYRPYMDGDTVVYIIEDED